MTTIIRYELFFSRRNGHPFMYISTYLMDKNGRKLHSHGSMIDGEYEWNRREMLNEFRRFRLEEADFTTERYDVGEDYKVISINKTWEG